MKKLLLTLFVGLLFCGFSNAKAAENSMSYDLSLITETVVEAEVSSQIAPLSILFGDCWDAAIAAFDWAMANGLGNDAATALYNEIAAVCEANAT